MSEWTGPTPIAQEYPKGNIESNGIQRLVNMVLDLRRDLRESTSNLLSTAGIRARPGYISSVDFDGTSRVALGTAGWMLGSNDAGPPYMALAGRDVIADLDAKDATILGLIDDLTAQQATLTAQQAALTAQQATLTDLVSKVVVPADFNHTETVFDPPGGAWYTASSVTLTTPAGFTQAIVTAVAYAAIYNTASADTTVHSRVLIAGLDGPEDLEGTTSGRVTMLSMFTTRVSGLTSGSTFAAACQTYSVTDFTAHAINEARISGTVLWLR